MNCHCGSGLEYQACCKAFHDGDKIATRAEDLLRSRFSAFVTNNFRYNYDTTSSANRSENLLQSLSKVADETKWQSLLILERFPDNDPLPRIRYVAFFQRGGNWYQIHELSFFSFENGALRYDRGEFLKPHTLGRNEACWCGSGKKLKRCHESTPPTLD